MYSNPLRVLSNNISPILLIIDNTLFDNITADESGGALYLSEGDLYSNGLHFHNTIAQIGGAATIVCTPQLTNHHCDYVFNSTNFDYCTAEVQGGAIQYDVLEPVINDPLWTYTNAPYGPRLAGVPAFLIAQERSLELTREGFNLSSGAKIPEKLFFDVLDSRRQKITSPIDNTCRVNIEQAGVTVQGNTISKINKGTCEFEGISIISLPGMNFTISVSTSAIDYSIAEPNLHVFPLPIDYGVSMKNCSIGSILINGICQECPGNYYSFDYMDTFCHPCKTGMNCQQGKANVTMEPGYWRKDIYSDDVYPCSLAENCLGGPGVGECKEGHMNRLCGVCLDSWFKNGQFSCTRCGSKTQALVFGIINIVGLLTFLIIIIYLSIKSADKEAKTTSVLLRILLNFVQEVVILRNLDLKWPIQISNFFTGMKQTGNVNYSLISYSCMYGKTGSGEDTIFNDQEVVLYLPISLFFICALFWGAFSLISKKKKYMTQHFLMTISVVHTTFLMHIFNTNLNMVSCAKMEHDTYWLLYDLRVQCWVGRHLNYVLWYTIPSMLIWCIILPVGILIFLIKYRSKLKTPENKIRFSFLCKGYKNQLYFWQFIIIFKKYFILIEAVLFSQENPALPAIAVLLCLLIYIILQIYFKPYLKNSLNATEMLAVGSSITMLLAGLIGSGIDSDMSPVVTVFVVLTFIILAAFFLYLVFQVIWAVIRESKWMKRFQDKKRRKILPQYESVDAQLYESRNPIFNSSGLVDDQIAKKDNEVEGDNKLN